jgi:preprotein translocase subunit SecG
MSGMFTFILIIQAIVAVAMITVILMQRSEGGGFAGGSPSGLMTARGAADFLTRSTAILATVFVALSILLAALAAGQRAPRTIDPSLMRQTPANAPTPGQVPFGTPAGQTPPAAAPAPAPAQQPATTNQSGAPLAQ